MRRHHAVLAFATALVVTGALAGDGLARSSTAVAQRASVTVSTRSVAGLGAVLVDAKGRTLYMFMPDNRKRVTCVGTCAAVWPPVKLPSGAKPAAAGRVKASLLGSDRNPAGGRVVTYGGWPLYTYVADTRPGTAAGQALNLNGGRLVCPRPFREADPQAARIGGAGRTDRAFRCLSGRSL